MEDPIVSALVVVRPAAGRELGDQGPVTVETIDAYIPDPEAVSSAEAHFRGAGFSVAPAVGPTFSITAPSSVFEKVFGIPIKIEDDGPLKGARTGSGELELDIARLPQHVREVVQAVTFTPPPDFGPTEYS